MLSVAVRVPVGLADDERANLVFRPACLQHHQRDDDQDKREENGVDGPAQESASESERAPHSNLRMLTVWSSAQLPRLSGSPI